MSNLHVRLEIPRWGGLGPFRVEWEAKKLSLLVGMGERFDLLFRTLEVLVRLDRIGIDRGWGHLVAPNGSMGFRFSSIFPEVKASLEREVGGELGGNRFLFWGLGVEGFRAESRFGLLPGEDREEGVVLLPNTTLSEVQATMDRIGSRPDWRVIGSVRDPKPFTQLGDRVLVHVPQHGETGWVR